VEWMRGYVFFRENKISVIKNIRNKEQNYSQKRTYVI
jgi:hypothetical protein